VLKVVKIGTKGVTEDVEDGQQGVDKVRSSLSAGSPYDLVLMDFTMPVMDGPTAASIMRKDGYDGVLIGVTGNTVQRDVDTFLSHGADAVLNKPLNVIEFPGTLKILLAARARMRAAAEPVVMPSGSAVESTQEATQPLVVADS
jgi:CheY-like chemotaxis protein